MKLVKLYIVLFGVLLGVFQAAAIQESIEVINNGNSAVQIAHPVPEYTKATISFSKIGDIANDEYLILALPEHFLSSDDGCSLNNRGQVAGSIRGNTAQQPKSNARTRWGSPLKMPWEKAYGRYAAVWSLSDGLITSELKNSRAVALNDHGFVAVSRERDLPCPDLLWNINTNEVENSPKSGKKENAGEKRINLALFDHRRSKVEANKNGSSLFITILDTNEKGFSLTIKKDPFDPNYEPELSLVKSGKYSVVRFQCDLCINKKRLRTLLPIVNVRLNENNKIIAMVNVDGKQAIGSWEKENGATISGCLQDNQHFKGYTNFAIAGFNNHGQILLRADVGEIEQLEYIPIRPRMYLLIPKNTLT